MSPGARIAESRPCPCPSSRHRFALTACVPCRAGNTLLLKALEKIRAGHGTTADLTAIEALGAMVKTASRCGLGQTSPNPLLSTIEHFREVYLGKVRADVDYISQFNLDAATAESVAVAAGTPSLEQG